MIKVDYIERLTQEIAAFVALLIGKKTKEALNIIDDAYVHWLKISRQELLNLDKDELFVLLLEEKKMQPYQLELLAEIMAEEGSIYVKEKEKLKAKHTLEKALQLFEFIDQAQALYSIRRQAKMQQIKNHLSVL